MTTKKDTFELRTDKLGEGLEESLGVPQQGQQDATGSYPSRDYNFGSSINKASRGTMISTHPILHMLYFNNCNTVLEFSV